MVANNQTRSEVQSLTEAVRELTGEVGELTGQVKGQLRVCEERREWIEGHGKAIKANTKAITALRLGWSKMLGIITGAVILGGASGAAVPDFVKTVAKAITGG